MRLLENDEFVTMLSLRPAFGQPARQNAGILSRPNRVQIPCMHLRNDCRQFTNLEEILKIE